MVISTQALVLQLAPLKRCWGSGSGSGVNRERWHENPQSPSRQPSNSPVIIVDTFGCVKKGRQRETFAQSFRLLITCKCVAQATLSIDVDVMYRARPLGFYICNSVGCITYDLDSAENDMLAAVHCDAYSVIFKTVVNIPGVDAVKGLPINIVPFIFCRSSNRDVCSIPITFLITHILDRVTYRPKISSF